jgi:hypothetical protein
MLQLREVSPHFPLVAARKFMRSAWPLNLQTVACSADNAVLMKTIRYFIIAYSYQLSERITAKGEHVNCLAWLIHLRETLVFLSRSGQSFSLLLGRANQSTNKPGRLCCLDNAITATLVAALCFVCIVICRSTASDFSFLRRSHYL